MKQFKTWEDFSDHYSLVLFNDCINLVRADNNSFFEGVIMEWQEKHFNNCEDHLAGKDCECEPMQWYAIAVGDDEAERLNKEYNLDIFYSETLNLHILPVYHYGTAWTHVNI